MHRTYLVTKPSAIDIASTKPSIPYITIGRYSTNVKKPESESSLTLGSEGVGRQRDVSIGGGDWKVLSVLGGVSGDSLELDLRQLSERAAHLFA